MIKRIVLLHLLGLLMGWSHLQAQTIITLDSIQDVSCATSSDGAIFITPVGVPPLTYQWSTGATTQDLIGVLSGSYRVTITDGNNATVVSSFYTINAPPALNVNTDTIINILCGGDSTGAVDISVLGGTAPYTYLWQNGVTSQDVTGLPAGPVGLTVTDANGCIASPKSIVILEPPVLTSNLDSLQNILCNGANNGAIELTSSGGTGVLNFLWSNGATTEDLAGLGVGMYTLTITDSNSCQLLMGPYTISEPTALNVVVDSLDQIACNGAATGGVYITASGGTGPYTYFWTQGFGGEDFMSLSAGTYQATVTDANGCVDTIPAQVLGQPAALVIDSSRVQKVSCNGQGDGAIDLTVSGGIAPYTYLWNIGATTEDLSNLPAGTYRVTIADANGCVLVSPAYTITEPAVLQLSVDSLYNVSCNGTMDGAIFTTVTGGTSPFIYTWSNGDTLGDITRLNGGTYGVTVTDSSGCVVTAGPLTIREPAVLTAVVDSVRAIACNGDSTGFINISVAGGNTPYSYLWNTGATVQDLSNLPAGIYGLTVTDSSACTVSVGPITVSEPTVLSIDSVQVQHVACNGNANGSIDVSLSGGTSPYSYLWSNGATTQDLAGLSGGVYTLTLTDANGCVLVSPAYTITEPAVLQLSVDSLYNVSCNGTMDGAIFTTVTGGTSPFIYTWSNGDTLGDITRLNGGTYGVTVTDSSGCVVTAGPLTIREPAVLTAVVDSVRAIACNGDSTGFINISVAGGNTPYSYLWNTGATVQDLSNLPAGIYGLTVTDSSACTVSVGPITVSEPTVLSIDSVQVQHVACNGNANGSIDVSLSGGTSPYSYLWSNGATTEDLAGLSGGVYTLTLTDANGCVLVSPAYTLTEPTALVLTIDSVQNISCNGENDGAIFTTITGGTTPYTYNWSTGATTTFIDNLPAGSYDVVVQDSNGCTVAIIGTPVTEPTPVVISLDSISMETCAASSLDGYIDIQVTGGTGSYSYLWVDPATGNPYPSTTDRLDSISVGSYLVLVRDANDCIDTSTYIITALSELQVDLDSLTPIRCFGDTNGTVYITAFDGVGTYTYNWSNGATSEDIINLSASATPYQVTVTDSLGCAVVKTYNLGNPSQLTTSLNNLVNVSCNGAGDGRIDIDVIGGTTWGGGRPAYDYTWNTGATTEDLTNLGAGTFDVVVTDFNGCTTTGGPYTITEPTPVQTTLTINNIACFGDSTGSIFTTVTGGTGPYTYNWNNGATTPNITQSPASIFLLLVEDVNGCMDTVLTFIGQPSTPVHIDTLVFVNQLNCANDSIGEVQVAGVGGTAPYAYNWSTGSSDSLITGLGQGTYTLTITDDSACTYVDSFVITPRLQPTLNPYIGQVGTRDTTIDWGSTVTLAAGNDQTAQGVSYNWQNLSSLDNPNLADNTAPNTSSTPEPSSAGQYQFLLTATSTDGCVDTASLYLRVELREFLGMPTAFSPNGDGLNDYYRPANIDPQFVQVFRIYNRWGQLIYDGTNLENQWDGTYQGQPQPTEVYIYYLEYQQPGQEGQQIRGEFTLLR